MDVLVLGSGSAGNSTLVRGGGACVLVDAGLSAKQLETRLIDSGVEPSSIDGVLLTHEHSDHTGGLKVFLSRWKVPVYSNALTARALKTSEFPAGVRLFETGSRFAIKDLQVRSFSVPHDASDPVGFRIEEGEAGFGVLTDLGYATRVVIEALRDIQGLLVETNYDDALLQNDTKRPWSVKQRIASRHGHLSNADAAELVAKLEAPALETVILCHLSRDCNTPDLALGVVGRKLQPRNPKVHCASQHEASPVFRI